MPGASEVRDVIQIPVAGALSVANGVLRYALPYACELDGVFVTVNTAPTGSGAIFRLNKNGVAVTAAQTTVAANAFAGQVTPTPGVAAGANVVAAQVPNTVPLTTFAQGDYVTLDVTQVGSTVAGSNAVVTLLIVR